MAATKSFPFEKPSKPSLYPPDPQLKASINQALVEILSDSAVSLNIINTKYQTDSRKSKGIKIFPNAPLAIKGDTGLFLPTANAEPASPYNGAMWTNPANAQTVVANYATAVQGGFKYTIWKSFTNLQTAIPTDATITGITVRCFASVDTIANLTADGRKLWIRLTKDGSTVVGNVRITESLIVADALVAAGGSDDLWETTWARTDFTSSFGVMITGAGTSDPSTTFRIDYIQVVVHYTRTFTDAFGETIAEGFIELWNGIEQSTLLYLKRKTLDLYIDKANLYLKGGINILPTEVVAGDTGAKSPSANATPGSPYNRPWETPANAYASDNTYATAYWTEENKYHIFKGFGLTIPSGATITGIKVVAEVKADVADCSFWVYLTKDGSLPYTDRKYTDTLTTSDALYTLGGSGDLWGKTWTENDFGANFGVMITGNTASRNYSLDHIQITVYYTTTTDSTLGSNFIPTLDDTFDLGSSLKRVGTIYARKVTGAVDSQVFNTNDTWIKPTGAKVVEVICIGAGGGGGSGLRGAAATRRMGGCGGGGGGVKRAIFKAADLGDTVAVTVGVGGTAGAAQTADTTAGNDAGNGGQSSFGTQLIAYGGGGGMGGTSDTSDRKGGGGASGAASGAGGIGGAPAAAATTDAIGLQSAQYSNADAVARNADWGGASGGGDSTGGSSLFSGAGGGAGGEITSGNVEEAGYAGGKSGAYTPGGGEAGGAIGAAGTAGSNTPQPFVGTGAGGGGSSKTAAAGGGALGGYGCGGGGGGASLNGYNSGIGGVGGAGIAIVITYF